MPPVRKNLSTLIVAARHGSQDSLGDLLEHFRATLTTRAKKLLGAYLAFKVGESDIVQETLMHAALKFSGFNGRSADEIKCWLFRILVRRAQDAKRYFHAAKRDVRREKPLSSENVSRPPLDRRNEMIGLATDAQITRIKQLLTGMPTVYQRAIRLHFMEFRCDEDIARTLGRSIDAVRKLRYRAVRMLEQKLETVAAI